MKNKTTEVTEGHREGVFGIVEYTHEEVAFVQVNYARPLRTHISRWRAGSIDVVTAEDIHIWNGTVGAVLGEPCFKVGLPDQQDISYGQILTK